MKKYLYSDVIMENAFLDCKGAALSHGDVYSEEEKNGIRICRFFVAEKKDSDLIGCPRGRHSVIYTRYLSEYGEQELSLIADVVSEELTAFVTKTLPKREEKQKNVLIAGLGNREITADSFGVRVADEIRVTRHLKLLFGSCPDMDRSFVLSALPCGVLGKTGIETLELITGAVSVIKPDVVIVIDALAARDHTRLGSVIQISDSGIVPGAGIGNRRSTINSRTLGLPVIALGVPTVVSAATLVSDALIGCGEERVFRKIQQRLDGMRELFVTPKDCDAIVSSAVCVAVEALERAFL